MFSEILSVLFIFYRSYIIKKVCIQKGIPVTKCWNNMTIQFFTELHLYTVNIFYGYCKN